MHKSGEKKSRVFSLHFMYQGSCSEVPKAETVYEHLTSFDRSTLKSPSPELFIFIRSIHQKHDAWARKADFDHAKWERESVRPNGERASGAPFSRKKKTKVVKRGFPSIVVLYQKFKYLVFPKSGPAGLPPIFEFKEFDRLAT